MCICYVELIQFHPFCFLTIVVLLVCHFFRDSCIFVFIAIFYSKKVQIFFSLIRFVRVVTITNKLVFIHRITVRMYLTCSLYDQKRTRHDFRCRSFQISASFTQHLRNVCIGHFGKYHNILCLSPKFSISIVSSFSWNLQWSQEKTKAILIQIWGEGDKQKSIMVFSEVACMIITSLKERKQFSINRNFLLTNSYLPLRRFDVKSPQTNLWGLAQSRTQSSSLD